MCTHIYIFPLFITLSSACYSFRALIFHLFPVASTSIYLRLENHPNRPSCRLSSRYLHRIHEVLFSRWPLIPFNLSARASPLGYSLTWLPAVVRNFWFGVKTAINSGLAVCYVPPPKVHCVEMSIPP